jgi:hypothetical protein
MGKRLQYVYTMLMNDLFAAFESKGLLSETQISLIDSMPERDVMTLYEEVFKTIFEAQLLAQSQNQAEGKAIDPFTFFAGASLRASAGCSETGCRSERIDFLGRYAALYANKVTMPVPLVSPKKLDDAAEARRRLTDAALPILQLRPVISCGIVRPVVMVTRHCEHTLEWVHLVESFLEYLLEEAVQEHLDAFQAEYQLADRSPTGKSTVYLSGPEDFLEHGEQIAVFPTVPAWAAKSWRYDHEGKTRLPAQKKKAFVARILRTIAEDTAFYLAYGLLDTARLLTNLPGEAFFLDLLTQDECIAASSDAMEGLNHVVPVLAELSLSTLVRIRGEERDSFESYRQAITGIANDVLDRHKQLLKREALEMLRSLVEPQLIRIKKDVHYERKRQTNRVVGGLAAVAAAIGIGAYGGFPAIATTAAAGALAVTGGGLLRKAAEVACEHGPNLRQQNDLYFLARLEQESENA